MLADVPRIAAAIEGPPDRWIAYGRSVGSIFALELIHRIPGVAGLVLESGIADVLERLLLRVTPEELGVDAATLEAAVRSRLDHRAKLAGYTGALLVIHCEDDTLVDPSHADRALAWATRARATSLRLARGGHNGLLACNGPAYWAALQRLADELPPPRVGVRGQDGGRRDCCVRRTHLSRAATPGPFGGCLHRDPPRKDPMNASLLYSPTTLGDLQLKNRVVMAPMTRSRAIGNVPNALMATYYGQRGEAGLIVTEGTAPSPNGLGYARIPGLYSDAQVEGWRGVTEAVHAEGAKIFAQLMHTGRVGHPHNLPAGARILAPSAITAPGTMYTDQEGPQPHPTPEAMTEADIEEAIEAFAHASAQAIAAGFDGVELHGANGYLIDQFLNTASNHREDGWGGSVDGRIRFAVEVARRVSDRIGAGRLGIRLSPYGVFGGMTPDPEMHALYVRLAAALSELGLAYLHLVDHSAMGAPPVPAEIKAAIRESFRGRLILAGGYEADTAEADPPGRSRRDHRLPGRPFLANLRLVSKMRAGQPLAQPDFSTFYTPGERGYTDYPARVAGDPAWPVLEDRIRGAPRELRRARPRPCDGRARRSLVCPKGQVAGDSSSAPRCDGRARRALECPKRQVADAPRRPPCEAERVGPLHVPRDRSPAPRRPRPCEAERVAPGGVGRSSSPGPPGRATFDRCDAAPGPSHLAVLALLHGCGAPSCALARAPIDDGPRLGADPSPGPAPRRIEVPASTAEVRPSTLAPSAEVTAMLFEIDPARLRRDVDRLAAFGTRHTPGHRRSGPGDRRRAIVDPRRARGRGPRPPATSGARWRCGSNPDAHRIAP
ncbi:MAG: hypothetical protein R3B09_33860 [Nannocystaceae bacterium]